MVMLNDETVANISNAKVDSGDVDRGSEKCSHANIPKSHIQKDEKINQQRKSKQSSNANIDDNTEALQNIFIHACKGFWKQIKHIALYVMNDLGGYQLFDRVAQWCVQHPQMAICIIAAGLVAVLPILLFFTFVLSTIVMTFTGFLVLEGTLLTILTMIMCGLLGALAVVFLFFILVGVATYFGVSHVYDMYGSTEVERTVLRSFMQRDKRCTGNENLSRSTNQSS